MPERQGTNNEADRAKLHAEIVRLNKIIQALMNRAERNASVQGSDFSLFQTAITLENQVRRRTEELEAALQENAKVTRALRESETRNRLIIEHSPMSIHELDRNGRIIFMNRAGLQMRGVREEGAVQGTFYPDIVGAADRERIEGLLSDAYHGTASHFEFTARGAQERIFKSCFVPIKDKNGVVERVLGITEDITERKQAEMHIRQLAFYDPLTQLPNRRLFNDRFKQVMAISSRSDRYGAVMFLDLDNFKPLNDACGHDVGDLLLIEVARRLTECVRETDTVARFGGDEFVVLLGELAAERANAINQAYMVAEKIRLALGRPYRLTFRHEGSDETTVEHRCTASIGVALFTDHQVNQTDILTWADMAMYQAKEAGRDNIQFFDGNAERPETA